MNKNCANLSIKESLKDAYSCLWRYKKNHVLIAYIAFFPFTLVGLFGFLDPFFLPRSSYEFVPEGYNLSFLLFILTTYIWAIPCVILWYRLYLLGPEHLLRRKMWPILTRSFVMISKVLFLIGIIVFLIIILLVVFAYIIEFLNLDTSISNFVELNDNELFRYFIIISLTGLITYLVFLRFSLAICARTIGKRMGLLTSWKLTEKNTIRMFCCFMVVFASAVLLTLISIFLYESLFNIDLFFSGKILNKASYMHIFILAPIITLPLSAMASQCSSFYRHCGGEDCMQY